jgi:phospho-2-dehydro-3-deoxyheptonate aldolase
MIESFLKNGNQNLDRLNKNSCDMGGLSVTDSCLGFVESQKMIE